MPEPLPVVLLAALLAAAVHCLTAAVHVGRRSTPPAPPPGRANEMGIWLTCHHPDCAAHNQTVHRYTSAGLICTGCGRHAE
ncbi:hypothetical protein AB0C71_31500 [Streptomyces anulatus]|uniref:hypothetical protein n=1 Tax=Streptomyces anulatus TaxID=1892 RepID=UPI0034055AEC